MTSDIQYEAELTVITLLDGLKHNYFSKITWDKDNFSPLGSAQIILPTNDTMFNYWTTYYDILVISAKIKNKQNTNTKEYYQKIISERTQTIVSQSKTKYNKQQKEALMKIFKQRIQNDEYNFSFIGRVARTHRKGKKLIIDLEDIGWKFLQYVPDEFRKKYVAGQPVDDAFQAMCEFMGVEFAYSLDFLNEYTFGSDGYSITKDNKTIETVPNLFEEIKNQPKEENGKTPNTEDEELNKLNKKLAKLKKQGKKKEAQSLASEILNKKRESSSSGPSNNIANQSEKKKKYETEFESKIKDLFIGNAFYDSELTDTTFHYDAITIQPKTTSSSTTPEKKDDDPKTPQDTKKSMKKTKTGADGLKYVSGVQTHINNGQTQGTTNSLISGLTSAPSPTNIMAGRQRIERQR